VRRNPGKDRSAARFSPGWVVVSYFLNCGGLCAAVTAYALTGTDDPYAIGAAMFVGAGLGGYLAGRGSPHRSYLEPALAAVLVVGSVVAFVYSTPLGRLLVDWHRDQVVRAALQLGGIGAVGGLLGALVGEATQPARQHERTIGWVIQGVFIAAGALFAAMTAAGLMLANEAAPAVLFQTWTGNFDLSRPLVSADRASMAATAAGAAASFVAGLVTQLGAPRRALFPAAAGAALVIGGAVLAIGWAAGRVEKLIAPAALFGALAAALAVVGALLAYLVGRATGRLADGRHSDEHWP
jgi:hypothetical protein